MTQRDITYIGITNFRNTNQKFGIKDKDRLQHMYVIGKSGTGKSTLLENMAISDIKRDNGLCIIDPHGDIAEDVLKYIPKGRMNDLIYFNATDIENPIAFNPLKGIHPKYHHLVASGLISTFKKIWSESWGPRMEYILRFTLLTLLCVPDATLLDIQPLLTDKDARIGALSYVGDEHILSFWHNEFDKYSPTLRNEAISPILNKTGLFITSTPLRNIVGQNSSSFRLQQVLDTGKILIVNLSKGQIRPKQFTFSSSMYENLITIHSNSKWCRGLGRRLGWIVANNAVVTAMKSIQQTTILCPDTMHQVAMTRYIKIGLESGSLKRYLEDNRKKYQIAAEFTSKCIERYLGMRYLKPEGGLYIVVDVGMDGDEFAHYVFKNTGVIFVPGKGFGKTLTNAIRISFGPHVNDLTKIEEAFKRIHNLLKLRKTST